MEMIPPRVEKKSAKRSHHEVNRHHYDAFATLLVTECPDIQTILNRIDANANDIPIIMKSLQKQYLAIKGHVQSGKTKFMLCLSALLLWFGISPVVVLRNVNSDSSQFLQRLDEFSEKIGAFLPIIKVIKSTTKAVNKQTKPTIYVCLGNGAAMKKIIAILPSTYMCLLDEVDAMDMGRETSRNEYITTLKQKSMAVFGVSATMLDPLVKERIAPENVILLKTSEDYKGIKDITFYPITSESIFSSHVDDDLEAKQPGLIPFLSDFASREPIENAGKIYPNIILVNVGSTIAPYEALQETLLHEIPNLCTVLYNAKGITVNHQGQWFNRKDTIAETLQWMKDNGGVERFPSIAIFSCVLAGRGVSFVSEDYEWHLNAMYLCVSSTCDEAELLQKVRLAGRYKDTIPLELHTTEETYGDMLKAYYKQEEILIGAMRQEKKLNPCEETLISDRIEGMALVKSKFSKRHVLKNGKLPVEKTTHFTSALEWDTDVYAGKEYAPAEFYQAYGEKVPVGACPLGEHMKDIEKEDTGVKQDEFNLQDELQRLEKKMFPIWSRNLGATRISKWLDDLDPTKLYTREEISVLCKQHGIPLQQMIKIKYEKSGSRGYGTLLVNEEGTYRLQPVLVEAHKLYFK